MDKNTEKWNKALGLMQRMDEAEGKHLNFVEYGNNTKPLVPLNESDVAKLLDRHTSEGYIIVSACRGMQDFPEIEGIDNEVQRENELNRINNERTRELAEMIKANGFSYKPVFGGFKEEDADDFSYEKSFFVFPKGNGKEEADFERLYQFGMEVCNKYNQDSFLCVSPDGSVKYIDRNGNTDMEFSGDKTYNDFTQQYFTDLHNNSHKYKDGGIDAPARPTRFTLTEVYVNPRPCSYQEGHMRWHNGEVADWSAKQ